MNADEVAPRLGRWAVMLERIERFYLLLLRASVLLIATGVLVWAVWFGISAAVKIARSPDAVVEQQAVVGADELGAAITPAAVKAAAAKQADGVSQAKRRFYADVVSRYYALYRGKFEPFRRADDKRLTRDEFDDSFVKSNDRLLALSKGELEFGRDQADLNALLATMTAAAILPQTIARLNAYRTASRRPVQNQVERYRTETRRGWDTLSTACEGWFESPVGCPVSRVISVPYTQTVTTMALPAGLLSHTEIFRTMQERYFGLLVDRRAAAASKAEGERQDIVMGNAEGWGRLYVTLWILGGFIILMFFFLMIAIERHQRRLVGARHLPR